MLRESMFVELAGHADRLEAMADAHQTRTVVIDEVQKLQRAIRYGMMPSAWVGNDPRSYLASYAGTYLREEVQQEALVRSVASFNRFLEAASLSQAQVLNVQAVAADCGISRKTVESHFDLLGDLLLAIRIPVFRRRAARRLTVHPKFFLFDAGVYRAIRPRGPLDTDDEIEGAAIETLVLESLRAENANRGLGYDVFFWRTHDGKEVDFVLYGERGLHAFEVKRSSRFRKGDLDTLRLFCADYPEARGHLFYGGTTRYRYGAIEVAPLADGLGELGSTLTATRSRRR